MVKPFPDDLKAAFFGHRPVALLLRPHLILSTTCQPIAVVLADAAWPLRYVGPREEFAAIAGDSLLAAYCGDRRLAFTDGNCFLVAGPPPLRELLEGFPSSLAAALDDLYLETVDRAAGILAEDDLLLLPLGPDGDYTLIVFGSGKLRSRATARLFARYDGLGVFES